MSQLPLSSSLEAGRAEDQNVVRRTECMLFPEGGCCDVACIQCLPDSKHLRGLRTYPCDFEWVKMRPLRDLLRSGLKFPRRT